MVKTTRGLRTWIEIDKKAIEQNYEIIRGLIPKNCKLMSVVKSNAYGHGLKDFAQTITNLGADWLGVDSITEARALRKIGIKTPILVLGFTLAELVQEAAENSIRLTISSFASLKSLQKFKFTNSLLIHLKVDTGMHRQGFSLREIPQVVKILKKLNSGVKLEGLYTHFASAKNPKASKATIKQIREFKEIVDLIQSAGFKPIRHAAATGGVIAYPESHFDMVRVGIGLYGMWPSPSTKEFFEKKFTLTPVLSWRTIISEIKHLPAGSKIGYEGTEELKKDSIIAVCPIGYWHGLPRNLSSIGQVLVKDERCKILGRVSMDMITIDISKVPGPKVGDTVTVIGEDKKVKVLADELANLAGTINYEIVTRLNPLVRRIYF